MGQYINKSTMIDSETGEVLKERKWIGYDGFSETGYKYRNKSNHIKYFFDSLPSNLSEGAWVLLIMIAEIMTNENVLVYRVERKSKFSTIIYKPYDKDDIRTRIRYPYGLNKFDKYWRELCKHCLKRVQYHEYMVWAVNPAIINKCVEVPFWLCDEFKDYMTPHLTASTIKKLNQKIDSLG